MPRKRLSADTTPTLAAERLRQWGAVIRQQRLRQKIRCRDLALRIDVSEQTLQRIEAGDPSVQAASYLGALLAVGVFDVLLPPAPADLLAAAATAQRVRLGKGDDDVF